MTRTYIIAADGTRFVPQGTAMRTARRTTLALLTLLALIFAAAAITGIARGTQGAYDAPTTPTATASPSIDLRAANAACRRAPKGSMHDCLSLYLRSAWHTPSNGAAAGRVLVKECFAQYRGAELRDCLRQPLA